MDQNRSNVDKSRIRMYYIKMFIVKTGLGIGLVICGVQAAHYTKGQKMFGPPYYIGAFIAGSLLILSSILTIFILKSLFSLEASSHTDQGLVSKLVCGEIVPTVLAAFSCFLGIFCVTDFGLPGCDNPNQFANGCNYNDNILENQTIATIILIGLILTVIVCMISVGIVCCSSLLSPFRNTGRGRFQFNARPIPVTTYHLTTTGHTHLTTTGHTHLTSTGQTHLPTTGQTGSGAVPQFHHQPVVVGMVGAQPNVNDTNRPINNGSHSTDTQLRILEEQNRLLREQLELQTALSQQQQQFGNPGQNVSQPAPPPPPPPPSYSECVTQPEKIDI